MPEEENSQQTDVLSLEQKAAAERRSAEYKAAGRIGRGAVNVAADREQRRLTEYVDKRLFPTEAYAGLVPKEPAQVTDQDIQAALQSSFALALETAAQVAEAELPSSGLVREDTDSLRVIMEILRGGRSMAEDQLKRGDNTAILSETRKAIARRKGVRADELQLTDAQLLRQFERLYEVAGTRIGSALAALTAYSQR